MLRILAQTPDDKFFFGTLERSQLSEEARIPDKDTVPVVPIDSVS